MKLSFSKQSSSSKPNPNSKPKPFLDDPSSSQKPPNHEYLTEFDSSKTLTLNPDPKSTPIVIPPKQNEWRPFKKMKNIDDLPPIRSVDGKPLEFELENSDTTPPDVTDHISYGLNVRKSGGGEGEDGNGNGNSIDAIMRSKLRSDLDSLPDIEGFDQFDEVPVDAFAKAVLAGYGWKEGRGIGRNAKEDTKVVEYKRRTAKEGIGFFSDQGGNNGRKVEKKERAEFDIGKEVRIVSGRGMGSKGRVMEILSGGDALVLRLLRGGEEEEVRVRASDIAELGSEEEENCLKRLKELEIRGDGRDRKSDKKRKDSSSSGRSRETDRRGDDHNGRVKNERGKREERSSSRASWLRSHIRVRIISKQFKGGRFYLKKGEVVDVVGPTTCDISMDDGREIVQGVDQDILETALPRRGGPVLVLSGKHKGVYGSLVEKDTERETGVVEDGDTRELLHVRLEQVAEYMGDPSFLGY